MKPNPESYLDKFLYFLADGKWHSEANRRVRIDFEVRRLFLSDSLDLDI